VSRNSLISAREVSNRLDRIHIDIYGQLLKRVTEGRLLAVVWIAAHEFGEVVGGKAHTREYWCRLQKPTGEERSVLFAASSCDSDRDLDAESDRSKQVDHFGTICEECMAEE
jgi:hypothetical protein